MCGDEGGGKSVALWLHWCRLLSWLTGWRVNAPKLVCFRFGAGATKDNVAFIYNNHPFIVKGHTTACVTENTDGEKGTGGEVGKYVSVPCFGWQGW